MRELITTVPDPNVLVALPTEELAMRLLPILVARERPRPGNLHCANGCAELEQAAGRPDYDTSSSAYNRQNLHGVKQAFVEAWAWLEVQGLIVPTSDPMNSSNGF